MANKKDVKMDNKYSRFNDDGYGIKPANRAKKTTTTKKAAAVTKKKK